MLQIKNQNQIDWQNVRRVLVVRLRSIGDTVLATPSLIALRRFLPEAQIDILLEDWVAPVLEGFDAVDNVLTVSRKNKTSRIKTAMQIRRRRYDIAMNLHGGTTATFFVRASAAKYRVGLESYQYNFLYTHLAPSPLEFWQTEHTHSAEQQLALLGFVGVPVMDRPKSRLIVTEKADKSIKVKLANVLTAEPHPNSGNSNNFIKGNVEKIRHFFSEDSHFGSAPFALIHPAAAFDTKQWATENFARVAEFLFDRRLPIVAVATRRERAVLETLRQHARVPIHIFDDLSLPEITALASRAKIFIGNDSGIAHIAAAVETPIVVIFGSSNINHWRPWTNAPHEVVVAPLSCQPCAGYFCKEFGAPECIKQISAENVTDAIKALWARESMVDEQIRKS